MGTAFLPLGHGFVIPASFNETAESAVLTIKGGSGGPRIPPGVSAALHNTLVEWVPFAPKVIGSSPGGVLHDTLFLQGTYSARNHVQLYNPIAHLIQYTPKFSGLLQELNCCRCLGLLLYTKRS